MHWYESRALRDSIRFVAAHSEHLESEHWDSIAASASCYTDMVSDAAEPEVLLSRGRHKQ